MAQDTDKLIASLVDDLQPVRPLKQGKGMAYAMLAMAAGVAVITWGFGIRRDIMAGHPDPMFLTASGLFLVLALASAWAVIDMARPFVGMRRDGWGWTALMAAVLPVSALGLASTQWIAGHRVQLDADGVNCLRFGVIVGLLTAVPLTLWLRRGAPSDPRRAGMLVGVAAGAAGIFAVSLQCPHNDLLHIGIWHGAAVIVMGLLGRLVLPRLLAW